MTHLIKAHKAKIQIMIVHTRWDLENISQIQIKVIKRPPNQRSQTKSLSLFLNALITADIPPANKKNHSITSTMFQNKLGEQIVTIQKIIMKIESHNINQDGHWGLVSVLAIKLKPKNIKNFTREYNNITIKIK